MSASEPHPLLDELDGFKWLGLLSSVEAPFYELAAGGHDLGVHEWLALGEASLGQQILRDPLNLPMVCHRSGRLVGAATICFTDCDNLCSNLLAVFRDPDESQVALSLYLRSVFWNHPLKRLQIEIKDVPASGPYQRLYREAGFVLEARTRAATTTQGEPTDVLVFGLLRQDYDRWSEKSERFLL